MKKALPLNADDIPFMRSSLPFWDRLSADEANALIAGTHIAEYEVDEIISNANICAGVVIVKSGKLRASLSGEDKRETTLYRVGEGEVCAFSASCIMRDITFDLTVSAEVPTQVFLINIMTFSKLQSDNVYVDNFALHLMVERFSDVMWAVEQILFMRFDQRLAVFLHDEMSATNSATLCLTHEQIARHIGSAREVVSRTLKRFEQDGLVRMFRGGVEIVDKGKLNEMIYI